MIKKAITPILGRIAAAAMSLALIASLAPAAALADASRTNSEDAPLVAQASEIASGISGECVWSIDGSGILTVRPDAGRKGGTLANLNGTAPWSAQASRIVKVVVEPGVIGNESLSGMFAGCKNLASIDLGGLSTSGVRDMSKMFMNCSQLRSLDLEGLDTSSVTNMAQMFDGCSLMLTLDVSRFNTSQATNMSGMFRACTALAALDVSHFDTSSVTDMSDMFAGCSTVQTLDVSAFDTTKVQSMQRMFSALSLLSLDLSGFKTDSLTDMWGMFFGSSSLSSLNMASFNTAGVTSMSSLFEGCSGLSHVTLGDGFAFDGDGSELPEGDWLSANAGRTFTSQQIAMTRNNIADTYVKSKPVYPGPTILVGAETVWTKGSSTGAMFRSNAAIADFVCVRVDDATVAASGYEKTGTAAATTITLLPGYLYGLAVGDHDIDIVSATGVATTKFTIDDDPDKLVRVDMYRLYNPNSGEHFYTADAYERQQVIAAGWNDEGIGWVAPKAGDPVYRLYNAIGGEHHYTLDANEREELVRLGWTDEGIGWRSSGTIPLYRQYNPNEFANNHNYTPDENEKTVLIGLGWHDEGVAWYGLDYGRS